MRVVKTARIKLAIISVFVFSLNAGSPASASGSASGISCAKAATNIETMICSSSTLRELDHELVRLYKEFQSRLPKEKRSTSTAMQRLWLKSRDRYCLGQQMKIGKVGDRFSHLPRYHRDTPTGVMLNTYPSADMAACLESYYRDAIGGFRRGAQKSYLILENGKSDYGIGIGSVDKISLSRRAPEKGWNSGHMKAIGEAFAVYLHGGGKKVLLSEIGIFEGSEPLIDGAHKESIINYVEIFLPVSGNPIFSMVISSNSSASVRECEESGVFRSFFFVGKPLKRIGISQLHNTASCGGHNYYQASSGGRGWLSSGDSINFLQTENHGDMFYRVFSTANVFAIDSTGGFVKRDLDDEELQTLYGTKFSDVYRSLMAYYRDHNVWLTKGYENVECKPIVVALRNYYLIKESLDYATVGHIRVLYNSLDSYRDYDELITRLYPLVKPLLDARELMKKSGREPVYPTEIESFSFRTSFYEKTGYPPMNGCLAQADSINYGIPLDIWMYSFWLRRINDGTDELAENILNSIVEYKKSAR